MRRCDRCAPNPAIGAGDRARAGIATLGKISEAVDMFFELEILPLRMAFTEINDRLGFEVVRFTPRVATAVK